MPTDLINSYSQASDPGPSLVGRICNNFEKNRALYDKSMKLGYMAS